MSMCFSGGNSSDKDTYIPPKTFNTQRYNFTIITSLEIGNMLLIKARFPESEIFNGVKIMIYDICHKEEILNAEQIDPHFTEKVSPLARFKGNNLGWILANKFCNSLKT